MNCVDMKELIVPDVVGERNEYAGGVAHNWRVRVVDIVVSNGFGLSYLIGFS